MECKLCGSTTICAACKATIAADKDVENAALRKEVERLTRINTWLKDPEGCHAANPGETGYHCDANAPCTPCRLRHAEATIVMVKNALREVKGYTNAIGVRKLLTEIANALDIAQPVKVVEPEKAKKGIADRWRDAGNNVGEP